MKMDTYKCSCLSIILKTQAILAEKIEWKIYVNQDELLSDLQNNII